MSPATTVTKQGFTMTFHSRFRVGASYPFDGVDVVTDLREPIPADHLKGLMRAEAHRLLDIPVEGVDPSPARFLIQDTYGTTGTPSPWAWSTVQPDSGGWSSPQVRSRVAIDPESGAAARDLLVMGSTTYAVTATFTVSTDFELDPVQLALIRLSGRSVHHLGAWRRRGLGWVGIEPDSSPTVTDDWKAVQERLAATDSARVGS